MSGFLISTVPAAHRYELVGTVAQHLADVQHGTTAEEAAKVAAIKTAGDGTAWLTDAGDYRRGRQLGGVLLAPENATDSAYTQLVAMATVLPAGAMVRLNYKLIMVGDAASGALVGMMSDGANPTTNHQARTTKNPFNSSAPYYHGSTALQQAVGWATVVPGSGNGGVVEGELVFTVGGADLVVWPQVKALSAGVTLTVLPGSYLEITRLS